LPAALVGGGFTDGGRALTPDPKEVAVAGAAATNFRFDLGSAQMVSAVYLGAASASLAGITAFGGVVDVYENNLGALSPAQKRTAAAPYKYYLQFPALSLRFIEFNRPASFPVGFEMGLAIAGERFSPTWGHEWGAGRFLSDTSSVSRNRAGGFGIERGAVVPGWDFTLGDLTLEETEQLFDMMRKVGESAPVVVAEDPDASNDLDARIHYGLFRRLEKYERASVGVTRWSLKVEDWI
jgi:hypothetical protein